RPRIRVTREPGPPGVIEPLELIERLARPLRVAGDEPAPRERYERAAALHALRVLRLHPAELRLEALPPRRLAPAGPALDLRPQKECSRLDALLRDAFEERLRLVERSAPYEERREVHARAVAAHEGDLLAEAPLGLLLADLVAAREEEVRAD